MTEPTTPAVKGAGGPSPSFEEAAVADSKIDAVQIETDIENTNDQSPDLGFGEVVSNTTQQRLLNQDGSFNVERYGLSWRHSLSIYHSAIEATWPRFLAAATAIWLLINLVFAVAYLAAGPDALAIPEGRSRVAAAFFFGIQTQSTIGFGHIYPQTWLADALVTVQSVLGFFFGALITGLVFARFARPHARLVFSGHAVVAPYRDIQALMFRTANKRSSQIINLQARVIASWKSHQCTATRRDFAQLELERQRVAFFPLTWTIVHPITEDSPLYGWTAEQAMEKELEVLVLLTGLDDTYAQTVNARTSYCADEVLWGTRFRSILELPTKDRPLRVNVNRINETEAD